MPDRIHTMRKVSTPPFSCVSCVFSCWHYSHHPLGWRLEVDAQRLSPSVLDFALCWRSGKLPILLCKQDSLYSLGSANRMHFRRLERWKVAPSQSIFFVVGAWALAPEGGDVACQMPSPYHHHLCRAIASGDCDLGHSFLYFLIFGWQQHFLIFCINTWELVVVSLILLSHAALPVIL